MYRLGCLNDLLTEYIPLCALLSTLDHPMHKTSLNTGGITDGDLCIDKELGVTRTETTISVIDRDIPYMKTYL